MRVELKEGTALTHTNTHNYILEIFFQPSAVQPSALPHAEASRSTGGSAAGLWVVETE